MWTFHFRFYVISIIEFKLSLNLTSTKQTVFGDLRNGRVIKIMLKLYKKMKCPWPRLSIFVTCVFISHYSNQKIPLRVCVCVSELNFYSILMFTPLTTVGRSAFRAKICDCNSCKFGSLLLSRSSPSDGLRLTYSIKINIVLSWELRKENCN